uniref:Uncharacterized protein n=1 Tax=Picea sitchensis TaxID=3332 RepID=D5ACC3_PICSI|nr:unknown [Picea sitchensis]
MLQLFSTCDSGGHQMLNLLILRAEAWIQTGSGEKILPGLNSLEALKVLTIRIFGSCEMGAPVELVSMYNSESEKTHFIKHPGLGRHTWADIKYRGDWMRRPIEDTEVAWLARLLVRISDWLNTRLGLDHQDSTVHINNSWDENSYNSMRTSEPIFAEIIEDEDEVSLVDFLSNRTTWINLFSTILSPVMYCSVLLCKFVVSVLRRSGCRINLRIMAEKKVLVFIFTCIILTILSKIFKHYS